MIFDILFRLRTYAITLTADVKKAFHQVGVHEKDRGIFRFLWFHNVLSDRWKKEYLIDLGEYQKIKHPNKHQQIGHLKNIVIVHDYMILRSVWKVAIVEEVINATDGNIRGSIIRVPRTRFLVKRPVNKLYLIEGVQNERKTAIESGDIVRNNKKTPYLIEKQPLWLI